jgi:hypothetical protein
VTEPLRPERVRQRRGEPRVTQPLLQLGDGLFVQLAIPAESESDDRNNADAHTACGANSSAPTSSTPSRVPLESIAQAK